MLRGRGTCETKTGGSTAPNWRSAVSNQCWGSFLSSWIRPPNTSKSPIAWRYGIFDGGTVGTSFEALCIQGNGLVFIVEMAWTAAATFEWPTSVLTTSWLVVVAMSGWVAWMKSVGRSYLISILPCFGSWVNVTTGMKFWVATDSVKSNSYGGVLRILGLP